MKDINLIKKLYLEGNTMYQISQQLNYSITWIRELMIKYKIPIKTRSQRARKYTLNEEFFDKINTEEKAYFLGWLWSDGYNNIKNRSVVLGIQERDKDILNKFKTAIDSNVPIFISKVKIPNRQNMVILSINSTYICKKLEKYGMTQPKVHTLEFPNIITTNLIHHFIRGYFEGDGSFNLMKWGTGRWTLSSTKNFCLDVKNILEKKLNITIRGPHYKKETKTTHSIATSNKYHILKIYNYLYSDAKFYLERKKHKMFNFLIGKNLLIH